MENTESNTSTVEKSSDKAVKSKPSINPFAGIDWSQPAHTAIPGILIVGLVLVFISFPDLDATYLMFSSFVLGIWLAVGLTAISKMRSSFAASLTTIEMLGTLMNDDKSRLEQSLALLEADHQNESMEDVGFWNKIVLKSLPVDLGSTFDRLSILKKSLDSLPSDMTRQQQSAWQRCSGEYSLIVKKLQEFDASMNEYQTDFLLAFEDREVDSYADAMAAANTINSTYNGSIAEVIESIGQLEEKISTIMTTVAKPAAKKSALAPASDM